MYFLAAFLSLALCGLGIANVEDTAAWPSAGCAAKPTYPPYPVDIPLEMTVKVIETHTLSFVGSALVCYGLCWPARAHT